MYVPNTLYLSTHFGCLHLLAIVNNVVVNMGVQINVQIPAFSALGYIPRSGIG